MSPADTETFNRAVALANDGQTEQAHALLLELSQRNQHDVNLLLWIAFTGNNPIIARNAIEAAGRIDPTNPLLPVAQQWLATYSPTPVVFAPTVVQKPKSVFEPVPIAPVATTSIAYNPAYTPTTVVETAPVVPTVSEVKRQQRTINWMLYGGLILLVVAIVGVALVFALGSIETSQPVGDLPSPPNSREYKMNDNERRQMIAFFNQAGGALTDASKIGIFTSSDLPASLRDFYVNQLKSKGWKQIGCTDISQVIAKSNQKDLNGGYTCLFEKGDQASLVFAAGPISEATASRVNSSSGGFSLISVYNNLTSFKLKGGDVIVYLIQGPLKEFNMGL